MIIIIAIILFIAYFVYILVGKAMESAHDEIEEYFTTSNNSSGKNIEHLVITNSTPLRFTPKDPVVQMEYHYEYYRPDFAQLNGIPWYFLEGTEPGETEEDDNAGYQTVIAVGDPNTQ
jgi:hypothetical protein